MATSDYSGKKPNRRGSSSGNGIRRNDPSANKSPRNGYSDAKPYRSYAKRDAQGDGEPHAKHSGSYRGSGGIRKTSPRESENRSERSFREDRQGSATEYQSYRRNFAEKRRAYDAPEAASVLQAEEDEQPYLLIGRNAVREAIKSGRSIDRVLVSAEPDGSLREIVSLARDRKLVLREVDRKKLDELCMPFGHGGKTANHQGIVAYAAGVEYCSVQDILDVAAARGEAPFVIVLDGIEDPHNLGSIIRSADCAGAHGVIIGKRRSASVTAAAVKASAGASEYIKIARVVNIHGAIQELKKAGVWIAGADMQGRPMGRQNLAGALALVIGSEGDGLSKLVRESCDYLVSIPMQGHIDSLNAGVAAAVLMFEKRRQDEA